MATGASAIEQIYKAVKADICAGVILPGARVNIASYCSRLHVSKSPVRNALYQLVGEGLLEQYAHDGFYRPRVIEQTLYDIYLWMDHALGFAFDLIDEGQRASRPFAAPPESPDHPVLGIENLFTAVAALAGNAACRAEIESLNARLRPIRLQEPEQFNDLGLELEPMTTAWTEGDLRTLRTRVKAYHVRRLQAVRQLVALSYREGPTPPAIGQ